MRNERNNKDSIVQSTQAYQAACTHAEEKLKAILTATVCVSLCAYGSWCEC